MGQEFGSSLTKEFWPGIYHENTFKMLSGLLSSEDWRVAISSSVVHVHWLFVLAADGSLSSYKKELSHRMTWGFSWHNSGLWWTIAAFIFYDLPLDHHLWVILLATSVNPDQWRSKGVQNRRELLEVIWRLQAQGVNFLQRIQHPPE